MLMKVEIQDWSGSFSYAPPLKDAVINTNDIISAMETESRGFGPWVKVQMRDGQKLIIKGTPDDFLKSAPKD